MISSKPIALLALADELWEALKAQCAATKDKSQVKTLVTVRRSDVVAALSGVRLVAVPCLGEDMNGHMELMARESDAEMARLTGIIFDLTRASSDTRDALAGLNYALDLYWNEGRTEGHIKNICYWQRRAKEALSAKPAPEQPVIKQAPGVSIYE